MREDRGDWTPERPRLVASPVTTNETIMKDLRASMVAQNMQHWDRLARPPVKALRTIKGGRLMGMTDINPQWRYEAMTAEFGPCGVGWKYAIDKLWTEPGVDGEVLAFAQISLQVRAEPGIWSDPIVGVGGNHLTVKESKGLRNNDECWKMAITDALSVALKMLGVAADIYAGLWDGSKFKEEPRQPVSLVQAQQRIEVPAGAVQIIAVNMTEWGGDVVTVNSDGVEVVYKTTDRQCAELAEALAQEHVAVSLTLEPISKGKNAGKMKLTAIHRNAQAPSAASMVAALPITDKDLAF